MKLFYKKDYEDALKKINDLTQKKSKLAVINKTLEESISLLEEKDSKIKIELLKFQQDVIELTAKNNDISLKLKNVQQDLNKSNIKNSEYELLINNLKKSNRFLASSKGGDRKRINSLLENKKELEENISSLEKEIFDLKSDRYLVKKIPTGRPPKTQEMKLKYSVTSKPNVSKFISKEHLDL